ncbi:MAG: S41 family peptidase [Saprospiraceae bacterium]
MPRQPSIFSIVYKIRLSILLSLLSLTRVSAQTCPCPAAFTFVREKTALNYAGFSEKVTPATWPAYEEHTRVFQQRADTVQDLKSCVNLCIDWLKYFNDRHLQIGPDLYSYPRRPDSDFALTALDSQTVLFRLPSMGLRYKPLIDSVLSRNKALLEKHPYLIIDCRGNGGGAFSTWYSLKPYLYTGPVLTDGMLYWASDDNAKYLLSGIKPGMPKALKKYHQKTAKSMKKSPGTFVGTMNARREQLKTVMPNPQKVVILVNERCASSCEAFLLWAMQSKKVTVMGSQTAGIADYGSINTLSVPCHNWLFVYPTARSNRVADGRGIDNVGIAPKIILDDQTADWIEFARSWLKER